MTRGFRGRFPRVLPNTILVLSSTLMALLAAETLARLTGVGESFGQLLMVRGVPTRSVDGVALWEETDPRNDGEDIRRVAADPRSFKIIGLGDSIMYGVSQPKEGTYLEQARQLLEGRSTRQVDVLNLAVPGYNTMQENAVYKEIDDQIKPDLVLVHFWGGDDAHQYRVVGGYVVDLGNISDDGRLVVRALPLPPRLSDFLLIHSRLYDLLTQVVVAYRRKAEPTDWTRVFEPLAQINDRVRRAGGRLLVLASPDLNGSSAKALGDLPRLQQFASSHAIEVIDVSEWLRDVPAQQVAMDGCHFNAAGHRLIGERLAEYLLLHDLKQ